MIIKEIMNQIDGTILTDYVDIELTKNYSKAFACDLMSDCLTFVNEDCLLITGLLNAQALNTAKMLDIECIIFVRGKIPPMDLVNLANLNELTIISTNYTMYETSGKLYQAGLSGLTL